MNTVTTYSYNSATEKDKIGQLLITIYTHIQKNIFKLTDSAI